DREAPASIPLVAASWIVPFVGSFRACPLINHVCERRQIGPSARNEVKPWVAPQGKPSDKAIGPSCPFPKGLTPMRGLICRPARPWGLPRPSPSFAYPIALGSNASRDLLTDKLLGTVIRVDRHVLMRKIAGPCRCLRAAAAK